MAELSPVAAALSTKVSDFWPARGRYFILDCLNLSPKILYAINAKIPSKAIVPTSDRFAVELVSVGTGVGVCMIVVVCVDAGADARDTAAAFNLVSSTTGVKATAISKAIIQASAAATFTFTLQGKSTTTSTVTATITATTDLTALKDAINSVSGSTGIVATLTSDKAGINITNDEGYDIFIADVTTGATTANLTVRAMERDGTIDSTTRTLTGVTTTGDSAGILGQVILSGDKPFTITPGNAANSFSAATASLSSSLSTVGNINIKTVSGATTVSYTHLTLPTNREV